MLTNHKFILQRVHNTRRLTPSSSGTYYKTYTCSLWILYYFQADILVSSAVNDLNKPTMVGRVLNSVGGRSFLAACSEHTHIGTGEIATTIGGNLPCNYVIHAVCCDWNRHKSAAEMVRDDV